MDIAASFTEYFDLKPAVTTMNVSVHEDNASALILAKTIPPEHTPRSKFFHFWRPFGFVKRSSREGSSC